MNSIGMSKKSQSKKRSRYNNIPNVVCSWFTLIELLVNKTCKTHHVTSNGRAGSPLPAVQSKTTTKPEFCDPRRTATVHSIPSTVDAPRERRARDCPPYRIFSKFSSYKHTFLNSLQNFTLIELLVVIAIIAILASILLPVLNSARDKAQEIRCIGNLSQLALGFSQYGNDYDYYPAAWPTPAVGANTNFWDLTIGTYVGVATKDIGGDWKKAALARRTGVLKCPKSATVYSYLMHSFAYLVQYFDFGPATLATTSSSLSAASYYPKVGAKIRKANYDWAPKSNSEIVWLTEAGKGSEIKFANSDSLMDFSSGIENVLRHKGRRSVLWFDGHASTVERNGINYYGLRK